MIFPYSFSPWLIRKLISSGTFLQKVFLTSEKVHKVEDRLIPVTHYNSTNSTQLPIRVYTPCEGENLPIVIFFHGGGWVLCNIDTHDDICRHICNKARCVVISVDYRLAPEFKFPTPFEDAYAAACFIHDNAKMFNGDPSRIFLSGDSAGGNFSIVCSQITRERNGPRFIGLALFYPSTELRDDVHYPSYDGQNINLNKKDGEWFRRHYFASDEDKKDPRASPIVTEDLSNLPPSLIITGEHDHIRDCGEYYGVKLQEAGVAVTIKRYDGVGHGFLSIGAPEIAIQALDLASDWIDSVYNV